MSDTVHLHGSHHEVSLTWDPVWDGPTPEDILLAAEASVEAPTIDDTVGRLEEATRLLSGRQRTVMILRADGMSYREIAPYVRVSWVQVYRDVQRACQILNIKDPGR